MKKIISLEKKWVYLMLFTTFILLINSLFVIGVEDYVSETPIEDYVSETSKEEYITETPKEEYVSTIPKKDSVSGESKRDGLSEESKDDASKAADENLISNLKNINFSNSLIWVLILLIAGLIFFLFLKKIKVFKKIIVVLIIVLVLGLVVLGVFNLLKKETTQSIIDIAKSSSHSQRLDVPLLTSDVNCWANSMHMILNYYSHNQTPFYKEVAYQGGTRFELRRQFIGGRLEDGTLNVNEGETRPELIEPWVIQPEDMEHLAYDLGYTYHHAFLKSSRYYNYMDIREQETGKENVKFFSDVPEAYSFLQEITSKNMPSIVGALPGHFVVFTGYDGLNTYINNPVNDKIVREEIHNLAEFLGPTMWGTSAYSMQWFEKTHEEKTVDEILWMLKEAAGRAYQNINYYADLTAQGIITDDYTDPISGNNVNHPAALYWVANFRNHIADFLSVSGQEKIALKYDQSAAKFREAAQLPQRERVAVLREAAEIEKQAHELFVTALPPPVVTLNEPTEIKATSMKLSWTPYTGNDFVGYEIYSSWLPGVWGKEVVAFTDQSINSFTLENLYPRRTYSFTLKVNKLGGEGYSNQVTAQTSKEVYIIKLDVKGNNVQIDWSDTPDKTFLKYEVHVSTEPGFVVNEENRIASIKDSQLTECPYTAERTGRYYFKVRTYYQDRYTESEEKSVEVGGK